MSDRIKMEFENVTEVTIDGFTRMISDKRVTVNGTPTAETVAAINRNYAITPPRYGVTALTTAEKMAMNSVYGLTAFTADEKTLLKHMAKQIQHGITTAESIYPKVTKVRCDFPGTVVFFENGTKEVVKCCEEDTPDVEKAVLYAMVQHIYGKKTTREIMAMARAADDKDIERRLKKNLKCVEGLKEKFTNAVAETNKADSSVPTTEMYEVYDYRNRGGTIKETAKRFNISSSTVARWCNRVKQYYGR